MKVYEDPLVKDFFTQRTLVDRTQVQYELVIREYSTLIGLTPSQFIQEAEDEEDNRLRMRKRKIRQYLTQYRDWLIETGKSKLTTAQRVTIIRQFYSEYEIELPRVTLDRPNITGSRSDLPTIHDIRKAYNIANNKYKAIILLMATSGMGSSEVVNVKYSDLMYGLEDYLKGTIKDLLDIGEVTEKVTKLMNEDYIIPLWDIKRVKTGANYFTFSSPESVYAILTHLAAHPPETMDSYIFQGTNGNHLTTAPIQKYFRKINKKCGWGKKGRQIFFRSHNLRKWFASTLYAHKIPQLTIDWWLGHRINDTTAAYFKFDYKKLREQYATMIPELTINDPYVPKVRG